MGKTKRGEVIWIDGNSEIELAAQEYYLKPFEKAGIRISYKDHRTPKLDKAIQNVLFDSLSEAMEHKPWMTYGPKGWKISFYCEALDTSTHCKLEAALTDILTDVAQEDAELFDQMAASLRATVEKVIAKTEKLK